MTSTMIPYPRAITIAAIAAALVLTTPAPITAQNTTDPNPPLSCDQLIDFGTGELAGTTADLARATELRGLAPLRPWMIRSTSTEARLTICGPPSHLPWKARTNPLPSNYLELGIIWPRIGITHNSAYPDTRNNGSLWAGRGLNTQLTGGVALSWKALSIALLPTLTYYENQEFPTITSVQPPGYSPEIYPWYPGRIDWPQRPGLHSNRAYSLGQSYIRVEHRGLDLSLSTENLWWGPAQRYPLILSNNAPGFPHLALGTTEPVSTPIGDLEARAIWGSLQESPYFDGDHSNDKRLLAGLTANLQPHAIPGLFIGFSSARVILQDQLPLHHQILAPILGAPRDSREHEREKIPEYTSHPSYHLFSTFIRWAFPDAGFEFYGEWGTNATWSGIGDFLQEPGRGLAFLAGFQQVSTIRDQSWIRVYGEHITLGGSPKAPADGGGRPFYTDERIPQGHTHQGQLLGASIGPGSDAQILGLDLIYTWGTIGLFAERIRRDEDAYFTIWTRYYGRDAHDIAIAAGLRQLLLIGPLHLGWKLRYEDRKNRNFLQLDGYNWDLLTEKNWGLHLEIGWRPGASWHNLRPTFATTTISPTSSP